MRARRAPVRATKSAKPSAPNPLLPLVVRALDAKKAEHLQVLDVREQSGITDFLVLATGTSDPHLRALRIEVEKVLDEHHAKIVGMDTIKESGWFVIDAFDVMVHLFTKEKRERFRLDLLWRDGTELPINVMLKN